MRSRPSLPAAVALLLALVVGSCTSSTEPPKVTSVSLTPTLLALDAFGATQQMTPSVLDQRGAPMSSAGITWSSNATAVATVSPTGLVTAVTNGTAIITATLGAKSADVTVTVAQTPVAPVAIAGNGQSGPVNQTLANSLQVRVEDRLGNVMAGRQVTFSVTSGGGSITTTSANSDAAGLASTTWTLGSSTAVLQRVGATVAGNTTTTFFTANPLAGPAVQMLLAPGNAGDGQTAQFGTAVAIPPSVQLVDVLGNGVAGATVTFSVIAGGGSITGASAVTNVNGVASVGSWTLGAAIGVNSLQASFGGLTPIIFTANSILDPCAPAGAAPITVGVTKLSAISATDCQMPSLQNYEYYKLDLASTTSVIMEMQSSAFDTFLQVYDFNTLVLVVENDDIQSGVLTNSRIAITLPAGAYLLRARTYDPGQAGSYTLLVRTALLGVAANVVLNAGNGQIAAPGASTAVAPSVRVTDEADAPVAGVNVTFATVPGFGSVTGASAVTNASGIATAGGWTLAAGANVLSATVTSAAPTGNPVVFSATGKAAGGGFDIGLRFVSVPTPNQLQTFSDAAARWETIITGDLPAQPISYPAGTCNSPLALNETIDDVVIIVRLEPIDGAGQVLGSAGPCVLRGGSAHPALGTMRFDTADLANLESAGNFGNVILHEMGHVLGAGTIWSNKGFLQLPSPTSGTGNDTHFNGPLAITSFNAVGGSTYTLGAKVPVENSQGGAGTRNSHWRESVLQNELMTGFINAGLNPMSQLTISSMQDLGYTVDLAAADFFAVVTNLRLEGEVSAPDIDLRNDVRQGPIDTVDRNGRVIGAPALAPAPAPVNPVRKVKKPAR